MYRWCFRTKENSSVAIRIDSSPPRDYVRIVKSFNRMRFKCRECRTRNENVRKIVISARRSLERLYALSHFSFVVRESERDERRRYEIGAPLCGVREASKCILDEIYTFRGIADGESFLFQSW